METKLMRALAAMVLAAVVAGGCTRQPEAVPAMTPQDLRQLVAVTDAVASLARTGSGGPEGSSERNAAMRQVVAALAAADHQYENHSRAIAHRDNIEVLGCIDTQAMMILDVEMLMAKYQEAVRRQDEATAARHRTILIVLAQDANECAARSTALLVDVEKRPEALRHAAVLMSDIYAIAVVTRIAAGLQFEPLLDDQIEAYERIAAKLGPEHPPQIITHALPKLKAALSELNAPRSAESG